MTEQTWPDWFSEQFERAASGARPQLPPDASKELSRDLEMAAGLARLDFSAESQMRRSLYARLARFEPKPESSIVRRLFPSRRPALLLRLAVLTLALFAFLTLPNSPVLAAFGRLLGYGYLSQTGFIRLDQTLLLPGPLLVDSSPRFSVTLLVAEPDFTRLWLAGSPVQVAGLELADGSFLFPRRSEVLAGGSSLWTFAPLPSGERAPALLLTDSRRIPLDLMPAGEVGLAPTAVSLPARTPTLKGADATLKGADATLKGADATGAPPEPCLEGSPGVRLCIQAAQVDTLGLHLLVQLQPEGGALPTDLRSWELSLAAPSQAPVSLRSIRPGTEPGSYTLLFAPFPLRSGSVTLRARSLAVDEPNQLSFNLPELKPSILPTPRLVQTPAGLAQPPSGTPPGR